MSSVKKLSLVLVPLTLIVAANLLLPLTVNADDQAPTKCKMRYYVNLGDSGTCSKGEDIPLNSDKAACCLLNALYSVRDWLFAILLIIAAIFIIVAGYYFVTASGDPAQVTKARNFVIYALIGVAVALLSQGLVKLVQQIVGTG